MINIFLDACIIIYWVEVAQPFYSKLLLQLHHIGEKYPKHLLTISRLSFLECLVRPLREKNEKILATYQKFFESPELNIVDIDQQVIETATQLRVQHRLRTPDALQAASCLTTGKEHLFLTNDKRFGAVTELNSLILCQND